MIDTKAIREVAAVTSDSERMQFKPSTVIAMVDRLEAQHEAIVKLREALTELKAHATQIDGKVGYLSTTRKQEVSQIYNLAAKALKDTEEFQ